MSLTVAQTGYKPRHYQWAYDAWHKQNTIHWMADEVNFADDVKDYANLKPEEKSLIDNILCFFTQGDLDIAAAYKNHFMPHFKNHEVGMMLSVFAAFESLHADGYAKLIDTLGMGDKTFSAFVEYKEMKDKHDYFDKFSMNKPHKVAQALAAFSAFGEGLQLFASFAMLLNFQRFNKMKGMGQIVTWSIRDETLHVESMIKLFKEYIEEYSHFIDLKLLEKDIRIICDEVISHEDKFIDLSFEMGDIEGLTSGEMKQYIRYVAGRRLEQLGYAHDFPTKNPLTWIEEILGLNEHANFFETRSTEYTKASTRGNWEDAYDD